jgi:hypothetical protein
VARAQDATGRIVKELQSQGYNSITVRRTLLGRRKVDAVSDDYIREIVINPATGEILRDYWQVRKGSGKGSDASRSGGSVIDPDDDDGGKGRGRGRGRGGDDNSGRGGGDDDGGRGRGRGRGGDDD